MTRHRYAQLFATLLVTWAFAMRGEAAWLDGYRNRSLLTATNLSAISSNQTNFPILVKFTEANFNFQKANTNGYDIRFATADGTTLLSYERERHDATAKVAEYWVKLPLLASGSSTTFYVYYRTENSSDGANATNVWDNYYYVHHMEETSGAVYDSTPYGITGAPLGVTLGATGFIGKGVSYSTAANNMYIRQSVITYPQQNSTFEAWFKPDSAGATQYLLQWANADGTPMYYLLYNASSNLYCSLMKQSGTIYTVGGTNTLAPGSWNYVAQTCDKSLPMRLYVNGVLDGINAEGGYPHSLSTNKQYIGKSAGGTLDEVRFSYVTRSESYLRAQNASMRNELLSYGEGEAIKGTIVMVR